MIVQAPILQLFRIQLCGALACRVLVCRVLVCAAMVMLTGIMNSTSVHSNPLSKDDLTQMILQLAEGLDPGEFENQGAYDEYLMDLLEHFPVDLNRATTDELLLIPAISNKKAAAINNFRRNQSFKAVDELLKVPGIGPDELKSLRPWVTVEQHQSQVSLNSRPISAQHLFRVQYTAPVPAGYKNLPGESPHYSGSPARIFHRQSVRGQNYSGNLTQVKLPGESMQHALGFDFTSVHAAIERVGVLQRLVIGDYSLRFGQGLVLWSSPSFGKGGTSHSAPFRNGPGVTPYRSSGQIRFLRGIASEILLPTPWIDRFFDTQIRLSAFFSNRQRSAVVVNGDTIRPPTSSPFHRTEAELNRRQNTTETVYGGNLTLANTYGQLGFTIYDYQLNRPVVPYPRSSYMAGRRNRAMSSDFQLRIRHVTLFGEYAFRATASTGTPNTFDHSGHTSNTVTDEIPVPTRSPGSKSAWTAGLMGGIPDLIDWVFSMRNYKPGYWSELGNGFGEGTGVPFNQTGWYFGFRIQPVQAVSISGFLDRFQFPQPRSNLTRSSEGWEPSVQLQVRHNSNSTFQIRIRYKERSAELEQFDAHMRAYRITTMENRLSGQMRFSLQYSSNLIWQSRLDMVQTGTQSENVGKGLAVSQLIRWQVFSALRLDMQWAIFDTDDFSSRIYLYEYDLMYVLSSTMVYGAGKRSYFVIRYQPTEWLLVEGKAGYTQYYDRPAIGSGHDRVYGSIRTDVGVQIRMKF